MDITITTAANYTYTVTLDSDTGRPVSVIFTGDESPDTQALLDLLGAAFPGYAYAISPSGWDATGDAGDEPEAIAHLRETDLRDDAAEIAEAMALNDLDDAEDSFAARAAADPANASDALSCEWELAAICDSYGCSEAVAARAAALYPAALLRLAREAVEADDACDEDVADSGEDA